MIKMVKLVTKLIITIIVRGWFVIIETSLKQRETLGAGIVNHPKLNLNGLLPLPRPCSGSSPSQRPKQTLERHLVAACRQPHHPVVAPAPLVAGEKHISKGHQFSEKERELKVVGDEIRRQNRAIGTSCTRRHHSYRSLSHRFGWRDEKRQ